MKKIIQVSIITGCLVVGAAGVANAQLPSERAVPVAVKAVVPASPSQVPAAAGTALLPSEGGNIPKGANWTHKALPSSSGPLLLSVAEKRKRLPSSAASPAGSIKKKSGG